MFFSCAQCIYIRNDAHSTHSKVGQNRFQGLQLLVHLLPNRWLLHVLLWKKLPVKEVQDIHCTKVHLILGQFLFMLLHHITDCKSNLLSSPSSSFKFIVNPSVSDFYTQLVLIRVIYNACQKYSKHQYHFKIFRLLSLFCVTN